MVSSTSWSLKPPKRNTYGVSIQLTIAARSLLEGVGPLISEMDTMVDEIWLKYIVQDDRQFGGSLKISFEVIGVL